MALTKTTVNDKIEVMHLAAGYPVIQVRTATVIMDDGVEVSRTFHRHVVTPDAVDNGTIVNEAKEVMDIAQVVFDSVASANYAAHMAQGE